MCRMEGEKKALPAYIWRKIMEGKKRRKEKKIHVTGLAFSSHLL